MEAVVTDMYPKIVLILSLSAALPIYAQEPAEDGPPLLAFKLLIRSTKPTFSPGEPLKLEVACVSVPTIAPPALQQQWDEACTDVKLETEEARVGGYWGGVGLIAWLQNELHLCVLPPGQSYEEDFHVEYTKPHWLPITIPTEQISALRGMVQINVRVSFSYGRNHTDVQFAQVVTAIVSNDDSEAALDGNIQIDAAAVQSGDPNRSLKLANELLQTPNGGALRMAVRLFDNTARTANLWTVIENAPQQREAIDLMDRRLKEADFVPDYQLLVNLTGMKVRLDQPLEFEAEDTQPYTEYDPELEKKGLDYFRSLVQTLVDSNGELRSARTIAIGRIVESLEESPRCPLGTYGVSSDEAAAIKAKLSLN